MLVLPTFSVDNIVTFCIAMSAKEIKALIEVGTSLGYSGDELKQFTTEERMRIDTEKGKAGKRETNVSQWS